MKNIFLAVITLLLFVSCKEDPKKQETEEVAVEEQINPNFIVEVFAYASQKDDFALYFTEDNTIEFKPEQAIWCGIEAAKAGQRVYFEVPEERLPTHLRLDFGLNKAQDSVIIEKIKLNYLKNSFEFKGSEFFKYFNQEASFKTRIDDKNGSLVLYKNGNEYKTPFFYPNDSLVKQVKTLLTAK